jgi:hypothetical protein
MNFFMMGDIMGFLGLMGFMGLMGVMGALPTSPRGKGESEK